MGNRSIPILAAAALLALPASLAAKPPDSWDGLIRVEAKRLAAVYLLQDADFRGYSKVMIDQPEVAFKKDWRRNFNMSQRSAAAKVGDADIRKAIDRAKASFMEALVEAYAEAGYQVVTEPGADVLRVSTAIVNLAVDAPEQFSSARSRSFAAQAGEASLVVEARDSVSGSLMGRAVDRRLAGDTSGGGPYMRNSVTNRADFEQLFRRWARISAEGMTKLKTMSPVNAQGQRAQ